MKLSIILPVYGVEKYIRQCVLSIIEQNDNLFGDIELIIINDGTKDRSIEQIEDLICNYSNIILINQKNQGLSITRNNGIEAASGDYVWFVDSDDWIAPNSLQVLFPYLDGKNDLIVIGAIEKMDNEERLFNIQFNEVKSMDGKSAFRQNCAQTTTSVLAIPRREFLNQHQLRFLPGILHEDSEFCPRESYLAQQITFLPEAIYIIRRATFDGRKSITTTVNPKRAYDSLKVASSLSRFKDGFVVEKDVKYRFDEYISVVVNGAIGAAVKCGKEEQNLFNREYYDNFSYLSRNLAGGKLKNKVESVLFRLFPQHICQIYRLIQKLNR